MAYSVMIINNRNHYYEYVVNEGKIIDALDRYIEEVLGFERNFTATKYLWQRLKDAARAAEKADAMVFDDRVRLLNSMCRRDRYKIKSIVTNYNKDYPISVTFLSRKDFSIEVGGGLTTDDIAVHYGDNLNIHLIANRGIRIATVKLVDGYDKADGCTYNTRTQLVTLSNVKSQVALNVATEALEVDGWCVDYELAGGISVSPTPEYNGYDIITEGNDFNCIIKTETKEHIPSVAIYKNGIQIPVEGLYAFDNEQWQGSINVDVADMDGHFRIESEPEKYICDYTLAINCGEHVTPDSIIIGSNEIDENESGNYTIQHWEPVSITLMVEKDYKISKNGVQVTMAGTDVTENCYSDSGLRIRIDNVIGNVEVTVSTEKNAS
jgi:hypothetical protein